MPSLPVMRALRELDHPPRHFLLFVAVNVVSWQNIVGPSMVLLARKIDMPEFMVGMLLSFLPFTSVLLLLTVPLVPRLGPKRVMMWAWFLRNVIVCTVFTLPLALGWGGPRVAWAVLALAILGFCVMRALGSGGWLPWLHEIVPEDQRSAYFSSETAITQVINVAIMLVQALLLAGGHASITRFLLIYAIGIAMGFVSLLWMRRIPGGGPVPGMGAIRYRDEFNTCVAAVRDRTYLRFMLVASFAISSMCWFGAANVMYMRDVLRLPDSATMSVNALASLGVLFTVGSWGRFTEHSGSGLAMFKVLTGHAFAALIVLLLPVGAAWSGYGMAGAVTLAAVFNGAFGVAVNRAMLNQVPETNRVGYTAAWAVSTALALGVTPLLAGAIIGAWGLWGFRACFLLAALTGLIAAGLSLRAVRDSRRVPPSVTAMLNPALPLRTLARIFWITLGLHESNQQRP